MISLFYFILEDRHGNKIMAETIRRKWKQ